MLSKRHPVYTAFFIVASALALSSFFVVQATSKDIVYPVKELGNCKNEAECHVYCDAADSLERARACIAFAKQHNLLPPEELEEAERYVVRSGILKGPSGCKNTKECDAYCEDTSHLDECLDFAQKHNLRSPEEIAEGRKILAALKQGVELPGGCRDRKTCETWCEDPSHMKECVAFAERAGFISPEEAEEAKKIIPFLERGEKTPGNCSRKEACEAYCADPSHIDECLLFAERAGLIPPEELADAKRFAPFIKRGETPGGCTRKEECEAYCGDVSHFEECILFAEKVGIISSEEARRARKFQGKGPGGCVSREECEEFCRDPENQSACINFAKEHGLVEEIPEIEAKIRGEVEEKMRVCAEKECSEFILCLQSFQPETQGGESGEEGGDFGLPEDIQGKLAQCIEDIRVKAMKEGEGGGEYPIPGSAPGGQAPHLAPPQGASEEYQKEYQRQYDEEYKKQYEAEVKRQTEEAIKSQVNCSLFEAAPTCDYVGTPDSQNYNLCKQCFPNR